MLFVARSWRDIMTAKKPKKMKILKQLIKTQRQIKI